MPAHDIVILALIITVFTAFGVVLGGLTWYCSDSRKRPMHRDGHLHYDYPPHGRLIVDDD